MKNVNTHRMEPKSSNPIYEWQDAFFNFKRLSRWLLIAIITFSLVYVIAALVFGYEMTNSDIAGSLWSIVIAAYLLHFLFGIDKGRIF